MPVTCLGLSLSISVSLSLSCFKPSHRHRAWKLRRLRWQYWSVGILVCPTPHPLVIYEIMTKVLFPARGWHMQLSVRNTVATHWGQWWQASGTYGKTAWSCFFDPFSNSKEKDKAGDSWRFYFGVWVSSPADFGLLLLSEYLCWQPKTAERVDKIQIAKLSPSWKTGPSAFGYSLRWCINIFLSAYSVLTLA